MKAFQPQLAALEEQLSQSQAKLTEVDRRETELAARETSLEVGYRESAAVRAAELVAGERRGYETRLADAQEQLKALRAEQVALREERQLKDEKDTLALEVQRQVDARLVERESRVRTQEQERAALEKTELQKKLDDAIGQLADAQRKMEQGSQRLQEELNAATAGPTREAAAEWDGGASGDGGRYPGTGASGVAGAGNGARRTELDRELLSGVLPSPTARPEA